ncbi:alpha/beta hydrolase [Thalassomonas haliotis]|uniref:Alpha/beta hydrolase n=1 Tax=Thalassomonas haliotis TaxID=485448 RepID=A0ABY7VEJ2_9GAMM|nr:alpha/beta hydrolase [Thalassomonas haliotis]WDE11559.1 alpha/beta hydrolase [Thalassomonas haliotis]
MNINFISRIKISKLVAVFMFSVLAMQAHAEAVKNIVLVHGAFVDASSWNKVMSRLMDKGYNVSAVQNPLTSLADDVEATQRVLDAIEGPVVLVGYSWGGVPITEAGNDPKVKGLVYIAAIAPDEGESTNDMLELEPAQAEMPGLSALIVDDYGNNLVKRDEYHFALAHDSNPRAIRLMAAAQTPMSTYAYADQVTQAAWRTKPSWYAVSEDDHIVTPKIQHWMADRMKATKISINSAHASILSHPGKVARLIDKAAKSFKGTTF